MRASSVGEMIRFGWETFKKRPWFLIGATIVYLILGWCAGLVSGFVGGFLGAFFGSGVAGLAVFLISAGLNIFIAMGWLAFFIKAHDDVASVMLSNFWHPQKFWSFLGTSLLVGLIVVVGFILFIIPGVIAVTAFMFAPYFVIDKGLGPLEALKASARITKGNRLRVLGFIAATALISFFGAVALIVGLLIAMPLTAIATVRAYRRLSAAVEANEVRQPLSGGEIALAIVGALVPVILIVVGIGSSIILASLNAARQKAAEARMEADLKMVQLDLELYYGQHGDSYPATLQSLIAGSDLETQTTMKDVSLDQYTYTQLSNGKAYRLCSTGPVLTGNNCVTSDTSGEAATQ